MRRTVFGYLALASLLLGVGVVAMLGLGRLHTVVVAYGRHLRPGSDTWGVILDGHGAWFGRTRLAGRVGQVSQKRGPRFELLAPSNMRETLAAALSKHDVAGAIGFVVASGPIEGLPSPSLLAGILVPNWFLLLAFAILPARWVALRRGRWRREELAARGLCTGCGYDLRATPGRCPECGLDAAGAL